MIRRKYCLLISQNTCYRFEYFAVLNYDIIASKTINENIYKPWDFLSSSVRLGLAFASLPSGIYNLIVAIIHPWVIFLLFSTTSTPNWTISPEHNSWFSVSDWSLLLLTNVPLLLLVSWNGNKFLKSSNLYYYTCHCSSTCFDLITQIPSG